MYLLVPIERCPAPSHEFRGLGRRLCPSAADQDSPDVAELPDVVAQVAADHEEVRVEAHADAALAVCDVARLRGLGRRGCDRIGRRGTGLDQKRHGVPHQAVRPPRRNTESAPPTNCTPARYMRPTASSRPARTMSGVVPVRSIICLIAGGALANNAAGGTPSAAPIGICRSASVSRTSSVIRMPVSVRQLQCSIPSTRAARACSTAGRPWACAVTGRPAACAWSTKKRRSSSVNWVRITSVPGVVIPPLTSPGGHCFFMGGEVANRAAMAGAIRERVERGVDIVKIMASGGMTTPGTDVMRTQFTDDGLRFLVDQAHAAGLAVTAHAHGLPAVEQALAARVDGMEHCSCLTDTGIRITDEVLETLADRQIPIGAALAGVSWLF